MSPIGDNRPATIATTMTGKTEIPTHPKVMTSGKASNITTDNVVVSRNSSNNDETPPPSSSHDGTNKSNLWLTMRDHPSIPLSIFLGLQHYITMLGGTVTYPYILTSKLCMRESDPARGYVIATTLFCSGVASFIQTTFGIRLPVIQGATFTFLVPTLAILTLPQWACPTDIQIIGNRGRNSTFRGLRSVQEQEYTEVWQSRMREISGAIIASSMVEVFLGLTGLMGFLLKFITPLSIVPTISLIGLSLFKEATAPAGESWVISGLTIVLMIILSQYITKWSIPFPFYQKGEDGLPSRMVIKRFNVIRMFPVLLTMTTVWGLCWLLTVTGVFKTGHPARTDGVMSKLISESPWFRIPYPFQWGLPTFSTGAILGMTAGVIASALESVGDYYGCARLCEVSSPPSHAVNRGIMMEGVGCVFAGIMGSGGGLTSYSENIGAIGITRVASRRVIQVASLLMIVLSICVKVSAIFATIPVPLIGGILMTMFGVCVAVGLSTLQFVDLNSTRNLFILGSSLFLGLSIPKWILDHPEDIHTGSASLDQVIYVLLSTAMFVGGAIACFLDNTIPGSDEERGVSKWLSGEGGSRGDGGKGDRGDRSVFDVPASLSNWMGRYSWMKYLPISDKYRQEDAYDRVKGVFSLKRTWKSSRESSVSSDTNDVNRNPVQEGKNTNNIQLERV